MYNLRYQANGSIIKLGTRADAGPVSKKKKVKKSKKLIPGRCPGIPGFNLSTVELHLRFKFLKKMSDSGACVKAAKLAKTRKEFNKIKAVILPLEGAICYLCSCEATLRHHVIPLNRGGANKIKNLVPLCEDCHALIHPWLKVIPSTAPGHTVQAAPVIMGSPAKSAGRFKSCLSSLSSYGAVTYRSS